MNIIANQKAQKSSCSYADRAKVRGCSACFSTENRIYGILSLLKEREMLRSSMDQNNMIAPSHAAAEMAAELLEEVLQALEK